MTGEGFLVEFWAVTIAASILIYLILDGFDLGLMGNQGLGV